MTRRRQVSSLLLGHGVAMTDALHQDDRRSASVASAEWAAHDEDQGHPPASRYGLWDDPLFGADEHQRVDSTGRFTG